MSAKSHRTNPDYQILVVDDIPDNLILLKTFLEAEGFSIEVANSGASAIAALQRHDFDLILLDVMMPDMSGFEVLQRLQQDRGKINIPILMITAHGKGYSALGLDPAIKGWVQKPIDFDELMSQIDRLLPDQVCLA